MSRCGMNSMPPGVNRTAALKPEGSRAGALERAVTEAWDPSRPARPDPEVAEKAVRRKFTAEYKRSILEQADAGQGEGAIGALLRREGLYSSHLSTWRRQRKEGTLQALSAKKRGRKSNFHPLAPENARLRAENARLLCRLEQAETIIEVQKKSRPYSGSRSRKPSPTGSNHERRASIGVPRGSQGGLPGAQSSPTPGRQKSPKPFESTPHDRA
ncbi:MAG: transposase [Gammaproteobacteria bacterium]